MKNDHLASEVVLSLSLKQVDTVMILTTFFQCIALSTDFTKTIMY